MRYGMYPILWYWSYYISISPGQFCTYMNQRSQSRSLRHLESEDTWPLQRLGEDVNCSVRLFNIEIELYTIKGSSNQLAFSHLGWTSNVTCWFTDKNVCLMSSLLRAKLFKNWWLPFWNRATGILQYTSIIFHRMKPRICVAWHGYDMRVPKVVHKCKVSWDDSGGDKPSVDLAILPYYKYMLLQVAQVCFGEN